MVGTVGTVWDRWTLGSGRGGRDRQQVDFLRLPKWSTCLWFAKKCAWDSALRVGEMGSRNNFTSEGSVKFQMVDRQHNRGWDGALFARRRLGRAFSRHL